MDGEECSLEVLIKSKLSRWCHDIGREQAANKPLLKTVFQVIVFSFQLKVLMRAMLILYNPSFYLWQVMMRLFSPRKTTLLFVIRDKTKVCILL